MFEELSRINQKPKPFEFYTTPLLWNDPYLSQQMLKFHLDESVDLASRRKAFIQESCSWIFNHFNLSSSSKICDFGCGPGLYTSRFAKLGAQVTGIDLSERSIAYAREQAKNENLPIKYLVQNYLEYVPQEQFDLITLIFCDFSVLNPSQRKTLLHIFYNSLKDDGALLLDVPSIAFFDAASEKTEYEYCPGNGFWSKDPYFVFTNKFKYQPEKLILDKYTIIEKDSSRESFNWLQCFTLPALESELHACGLRIKDVYSDVAGKQYLPTSPEIAVVAKKTPFQGNSCCVACV